MKRVALTVLTLLVGCGGHPTASPAPPSECADAGNPPSTLECTGLYTNLATKEVAPTARSYAPAVPLWADGAGKDRWIDIPSNGKIDRSTPTEWSFPVGTKVWKEFSVGGKRVETRFLVKLTATFWAYATYVWSADDSAAPRSFGGDIPFAGNTYHVPTPSECDQCHRGRKDRVLGFEEVSLGLAGATGLTLAELSTEGLLTPPPPRTSLTIGDDGTGAAAPAFAWMHINCGTTCHNDNTTATAYGAGMRLRLDPTLLDGRSSSMFDSLTTTVGITATTPGFSSESRIVPGDPTDSLLVQLISMRGMEEQMPPIASRVVDQPDDALVSAWIGKMPLQVVPDAGMPDSGEDAGTADAGDGGLIGDGAGPDATLRDGGEDGSPERDGEVSEATASDAGIGDAGVHEASDDGG